MKKLFYLLSLMVLVNVVNATDKTAVDGEDRPAGCLVRLSFSENAKSVNGFEGLSIFVRGCGAQESALTGEKKFVPAGGIRFQSSVVPRMLVLNADGAGVVRLLEERPNAWTVCNATINMGTTAEGGNATVTTFNPVGVSVQRVECLNSLPMLSDLLSVGAVESVDQILDCLLHEEGEFAYDTLFMTESTTADAQVPYAVGNVERPIDLSKLQVAKFDKQLVGPSYIAVHAANTETDSTVLWGNKILTLSQSCTESAKGDRPLQVYRNDAQYAESMSTLQALALVLGVPTEGELTLRDLVSAVMQAQGVQPLPMIG